jgi:DNA-binding response OmpR family regulator
MAVNNAHPGLQKSPKRFAPRARVLIVEDNDRLRSLMMDVLAFEGYEVTEASDAQGMRRLMRTRTQESYPAEPFDLIVTDIQMPGEDGLRMLEWFRSRGCPIPALVVTAFPERATREQVERLHAAVLAKPFSLGELRSFAAAVLADDEKTLMDGALH